MNVQSTAKAFLSTMPHSKSPSLTADDLAARVAGYSTLGLSPERLAKYLATLTQIDAAVTQEAAATKRQKKQAAAAERQLRIETTRAMHAQCAADCSQKMTSAIADASANHVQNADNRHRLAFHTAMVDICTDQNVPGAIVTLAIGDHLKPHSFDEISQTTFLEVTSGPPSGRHVIVQKDADEPLVAAIITYQPPTAYGLH